MKTRLKLMAVSSALLLASPLLRAEELIIDGVTYHEVRWGALTPATVSVIHARGIETVPLEKLAPDLQRRFHYDPQRAAQYRAREEARETARLLALERAERARTVTPLPVGRGVPTAPPPRPVVAPTVELTGFLVKTGEPFLENGQRQEGALLELAKPRGKLPADPLYQLRPGLWESDGEFVFLKRYTTDLEPGIILRVRALPAGEVRGLRAFVVVPSEPEQESTEGSGGINAASR